MSDEVMRVADGHELPFAKVWCEAPGLSRLHTQHTDDEKNGAMKFQSLASGLLGFVTVAVCSCALAFYAVGTGWYWSAIGQLPGPVAKWLSLAVARARPLLAEDTTVAEEQAEFYLAWLLVCGISILGWIAASAFRRIWFGRRVRTD